MDTTQNAIKSVQKRDGRICPFDEKRITNAILKAMAAAADGKGEDRSLAESLTTSFMSSLRAH